MGNGFTAKDFRTWGGTLLAATQLAKHGPAESEAQAKRVLASVMRKVGEELGNTPAVARASYVSPTVVEHYLAGRTIEQFRPTRRSRSSLRMDEVRAHAHAPCEDLSFSGESRGYASSIGKRRGRTHAATGSGKRRPRQAG